ncbi:MAG: HD domain-containing protein [Roseiflexaceae bacterium]|nr:HD domain-containing protein [Roseiflexaceae bacterium]
MSSSNFRLAIATYIREQAQPLDKYSHQPRLYAVATDLGEDQSYDDDILYAAAWLHDIGVFIGHRPADPHELASWDNVAYAVQTVPQLLAHWNFPDSKVAAVVGAIATHLPHQQPTTTEGILLRDADILEQLGAIAILRTVSKVGRDTRFRTFADAVQQLQRNVDTLPRQLHLPKAHQRAQSRIQSVRAFLTAAHEEAMGLPL